MHRGFIDRIGTGLREVDVVRSVVEHLAILLNTRAGEAVTVPDFGLQDLTDLVHELPEGIHTIQQGMRNVILKYEPRLSNVSVRHLPDDSSLVLRFEVVARVKDSKRSLIRLHTAMKSDGRFALD
ncbi:MAG: type VI secretion system baseplate subunit TssE [Myxococcales bacterium]|nr:type VI secretion system baseplate subunit TssE [Myxococcales bacterium]